MDWVRLVFFFPPRVIKKTCIKVDRRLENFPEVLTVRLNGLCVSCDGRAACPGCIPRLNPRCAVFHDTIKVQRPGFDKAISYIGPHSACIPHTSIESLIKSSFYCDPQLWRSGSFSIHSIEVWQPYEPHMMWNKQFMGEICGFFLMWAADRLTNTPGYKSGEIMNEWVFLDTMKGLKVNT